MGAFPVFACAAIKDQRGWSRPDANGDRCPAGGGHSHRNRLRTSPHLEAERHRDCASMARGMPWQITSFAERLHLKISIVPRRDPACGPPSRWLWLCLILLLTTAMGLFLVLGQYTRRETVTGQLVPASGLINITALSPEQSRDYMLKMANPYRQTKS